MYQKRKKERQTKKAERKRKIKKMSKIQTEKQTNSVAATCCQNKVILPFISQSNLFYLFFQWKNGNFYFYFYATIPLIKSYNSSWYRKTNEVYTKLTFLDSSFCFIYQLIYFTKFNQINFFFVIKHILFSI